MIWVPSWCGATHLGVHQIRVDYFDQKDAARIARLSARRPFETLPVYSARRYSGARASAPFHKYASRCAKTKRRRPPT